MTKESGEGSLHYGGERDEIALSGFGLPGAAPARRLKTHEGSQSG
jgi:hypothetical protein